MRKGTYRASSDVPDLTAVHHVVERLHDFLPRSVTVQPVDLQHIDIGTQSLNAGVDGIEDVLARQTNTVHKAAVVVGGGGDGRHLAFVVDTVEALGEDDNTVAGDVVLLQGLSEDFLGLAVGVDVRLGNDNVSLNHVELG